MSEATAFRTAPVFRKALADSVPVMAGYGTMGFAAGVLLAVNGGIDMPALWGALSSAAFISGPLQYLFVDWVRTSLSIGSVLAIVLCVNLRYSLYGLSLLETFRGARLWQRLYLIAGITDETYALEVACRMHRHPSASTACSSPRSTTCTGWLASRLVLSPAQR